MKRIVLACAFVIVGLSGSAMGQGVIIPGPCRRCPPRPIPQPLPHVLDIKSITISTAINSQVASTKVVQVFRNDTPYVLEGTYLFPIPESASVSDFAIYDGNFRMAGEVVQRGKAREIYNEIVRKMRDPGLLEYSGKNLIEADVFPIPPRSDKKIELTYSQVLTAESGVVSYKYPLGTGRNLVERPAATVAGTVQIESPAGIRNVFSPTHQISVSNEGDRKAKLSFEASGRDAQNDFQLYYSLSEKEFGLSLLTYREPGQPGYFLMLLSPKNAISESQRLPKEIVFVLDTSGSMSGEKIDSAKAALRFGVESLDERDTFNVISFSGEVHLMSEGLIEATRENKKKGLNFIANLRAEGGTNIDETLVNAFHLFEESKKPQMIVFLTDGQPTVGVTDLKSIYKDVENANTAHVRLFSFGVGYDVNTTLLDKLSADNRGVSDYIQPHENLEVKVSNFFAKVNYPVLSGLALNMGGVETENTYPKSLPDLFKGSQVVLVGRYMKPSGETTIKLSGDVNGERETFTFDGKDFPSEARANDFLPRLWAVRRVGYLLEQIRLNGEAKELVDEIVSLGTRYGIVTPYTSFLVTEPPRDDEGRPIPLNSPGDGRPYTPYARRGAKGRDKDYSGQPGVGNGTGSGAVKQSVAEKGLQESVLVTDGLVDMTLKVEERPPLMRIVGGKTFLHVDSVWTDTEYKEDTKLPRVEVTYGSKEFFDLIAALPKLSEYFSLGQKVIVIYDGKVYSVK